MKEFLDDNLGLTVVVTTDQITERLVKEGSDKVERMVATALFGKLNKYTDECLYLELHGGKGMIVNRNNVVTVAEYDYNK